MPELRTDKIRPLLAPLMAVLVLLMVTVWFGKRLLGATPPPAPAPAPPAAAPPAVDQVAAQDSPLAPPQRAFVIAVNGKDVVGLPDRSTAQAVVDELKENYARSLTSEGKAVLEHVGFLEEIRIHEELVPPERVRTKEQAKQVLLRGTDQLLYYTVQRGDSLWSIARSRNLSVKQLEQANPGVTAEQLQPGQQLSLLVPTPYINLESTQRETVIENIPFTVREVENAALYPWQSRYAVRGFYGKKQVELLLRRQNGTVVERRVLGEKVLSEPQEAVYERGTKQAPQLGTGRFILPIRGELTSGYGWRDGEFHKGFDLAAPWGEPVRAADAGTVVEAEWKSGYGYAVVIDHGNGGLSTLYGHLSSFSVAPGQVVRQGAVIGYNGSTGRSTGPHVHFEIRKNGMPVNPAQYFPD